MKLKFHEDINEFYDHTYEFLINREAENNLLFAILNGIRSNPSRLGEDKPILTTIIEGNEIKLVSLRTPPYNQVFSYTDDINTIDVLVDELLKKNMKLPGVLGFKNGVGRFTKLWCKNKNLNPHLIRNERIYKLEEVNEETLGNRKFIIGSEVNQELILKWGRDFILEALPETNETRLQSNLKHIIEDIKNEKIFLLLNGNKVVSMARKAGKTPNGNLVNFVYTPPPLRRRGYATECVAKLSKRLLEEGNKFCFLFTDLMNPTSNSIYQKIGYRPVIDVDEYEFLTK